MTVTDCAFQADAFQNDAFQVCTEATPAGFGLPMGVIWPERMGDDDEALITWFMLEEG